MKLYLPANATRAKLKWHLHYLILISALQPDAITNPDVKSFFDDFADWLSTCSDTEVILKAPRIYQIFQQREREFLGGLKLKRPPHEIGREFGAFFEKGTRLRSEGIPYGWLDERLECSAYGIPEDMPYHARIGLAHHAGFTAIEEGFLLKDALFLLAKAKQLLDSLERERQLLQEADMSCQLAEELSAVNESVACYARTSIVTFFSFIECFVNSIGADFIERHSNVPIPDKEILRGKKKGKWLSLERKIELFPSLIRDDRVSPIRLSDKERLSEPFASFFHTAKPLRDSAMHHAKDKEGIWRGPLEWTRSAEECGDMCIGVARAFWAACYPNRSGPKYLHDLDRQSLNKLADTRRDLEHRYVTNTAPEA